MQRDDTKIKGLYAKRTLRCAMRKTHVIFVSDFVNQATEL